MQTSSKSDRSLSSENVRGRRSYKKERKRSKRNCSRDSKNRIHSMDEDEVPVHVEVPVPGAPPASVAVPSECASMPENVSNGDIFRLAQCSVNKVEQMQSQICKTDEFPAEMWGTCCEPVHDLLPSRQGWRVGLTILTEGLSSWAEDQAAPASSSNNAWGICLVLLLLSPRYMELLTLTMSGAPEKGDLMVFSMGLVLFSLLPPLRHFRLFRFLRDQGILMFSSATPKMEFMSPKQWCPSSSRCIG